MPDVMDHASRCASPAVGHDFILHVWWEEHSTPGRLQGRLHVLICYLWQRAKFDYRNDSAYYWITFRFCELHLRATSSCSACVLTQLSESHGSWSWCIGPERKTIMFNVKSEINPALNKCWLLWTAYLRCLDMTRVSAEKKYSVNHL